MRLVISYKPVSDAWTTHHAVLPEGATALANIDGVVYVALPEGAALTAVQPPQIAPPQSVRMTADMVSRLQAASPHAARLQAAAARRAHEGQAPAQVQAWLDDELAALGFAIDPLAHVPAQVTMRQARAVLILAGLMPAVEAAIDAIPDATAKALARNEWERSTTVERHRGLVQQLGAGLGLTDAQLDALFVQAASIP